MNKNRALILAVTSCFIVAACAEKAEAPKKAAAAASIPKPPEAPVAAPASAGQDAKTAEAPMKVADATVAAKGAKRCKKNDAKCDFIVTVGANCAITLTDNGDVEIEKGRDNDKIEWKLESTDYQWKGKGITWKDETQAQFVNHKKQGAVVSWNDLNTDTKKYKYTVHLETIKDQKPCKLDPTVINGVNP
jgi:hypothetical protein